MARRRKRTSRKTSTRKRRVSGVGGSLDIQGLLLAGAGAFAANKINAMLSKDPTKTTMVNLAPYAALAGGIGLQLLVKNPMVKPLAVGMAAAGFVQALKQIAPGMVGELPLVPVIAGTSNRYRKQLKVNPALNGVGYNLPYTSAYKDSMSVVNGVGGYTPGGASGSAYLY